MLLLSQYLCFAAQSLCLAVVILLFNPIGKWENIETKTVDGLDVEDPYDRSFYLIFRHDGTAYMTLGDTKLDVDFSYIYDDESVTITSKPQNSDNKPVSVKYKLKRKWHCYGK